jgi:beta propeller repeat protein
VVYVGSDASGGDQIMLYDLSSGSTRALTTARSGKSTPRVSDTRVVWTDNRSGSDDVYSLDLTTNVEALLAGGPGSETVGDISGNRVVYSSTDAAGGNGVVYLFTYTVTTPPSDLPFGCDPAKTDLVDGPTTLTETSRRPVYASHRFSAQTGKTYYICVDNGKPDGSMRSAHVLAAVDNAMVLSPADFKPEKDPPRHVAEKLWIGKDRHGRDHGPPHLDPHQWDAALFASGNATISVSIRVAK